MRMDKLTSRFQSALSDAQSLAVGRDHQFIEPLHLMVALLEQDGGGTRHLLTQAGVQVQSCVRNSVRLSNDCPKLKAVKVMFSCLTNLRVF